MLGLDDILEGGAADRARLIEGRPGSGKTTPAPQFPLDGALKGARCLSLPGHHTARPGAQFLLLQRHELLA